MRFIETPLPGVLIIKAEPHEDDRGAFARLYCPEEFERAGLDFTSTQINLSRNPNLHTLRGLHWQDPPYAEAKVVRVVRGRIWDVAVDLRPGPTQMQWTAVELDEAGMRALYLPEGIAHGFITLRPDTDVLYQMGRPYTPGQARGARWNDAAFDIKWPATPALMSPQDEGWPDFRP